jgi:hypothetical protein
MKVTHIKDVTYNVEISKKEKDALIRVIKYIIEELECELSTRTGFSDIDYGKLIELLNNEKENTQLIQKDHLIMLHQALNEVCHGLSINEFYSKFRFTKVELKVLLTYLDEILK